MSIHKCTNKCKGMKFNGLKINCHRCGSPTYIECIAKLHEIRNFCVFFEIPEYEKEDQDRKKDYVAKGTQKIDTLFHDDSLVEFVCQSCKEKPSYATMKNSLEQEINSLNDRLKKNVQQNNSDDNDDKIDELQTEIAKLKSEIDTKIEQNEKLNNELNTALVLLQSNFDKFKAEFETELLKLMQIITDNNKNDDSLPSKSNKNTDNTKKIDTQFVNTRSRGNKKSEMSPFAAPFESPIEDNNPHIQPVNNNINPNEGLYEIYIAKFRTSVNCEQISNHIIESTNIENSESFHVQMLGGFWDGHSFASFKITTLNYEICNEILNMNWNPQSARIFARKSPKRKSNNFRMNMNRFKNHSYNNFNNNHYEQRMIHENQPRNSNFTPREQMFNRTNNGEFSTYHTYNSSINNMNRDDGNFQNQRQQQFYNRNINAQPSIYHNRNYQQNQRHRNDMPRNLNGPNKQNQQKDFSREQNYNVFNSNGDFLAQDRPQYRQNYNPFRKNNNNNNYQYR